MKKKNLWLLALLLITFCLLLAGCGGAKPSASAQKKAIAEVFDSERHNPVFGVYDSFDYKLEKSDTDGDRFEASYLLSMKNDRSAAELALRMRWKKYDQGWEVKAVDCQLKDAYPFKGPDDGTWIALVNEYAEDTFVKRPSISPQTTSVDTGVLSSEWDKKSQTARATVQITVAYPMFTEFITTDYDLQWDSREERWKNPDFPIAEDMTVEYDLSPLNGTWNAVYSHPSNYLVKDVIPYTFTFSKAGRFLEKDGEVSVGTVMVQHGLNELWENNLNPETTQRHFPAGVNYESGEMTICKETYMRPPEFVIYFRETNVKRTFTDESVGELIIRYDSIVYKDALALADACELTRAG